MINSVAKKHKDCELSIRWTQFKGRSDSTAGLFCIKHDKFMDWVPTDLAQDLIINYNLPVQPWAKKKSK